MGYRLAWPVEVLLAPIFPCDRIRQPFLVLGHHFLMTDKISPVWLLANLCVSLPNLTASDRRRFRGTEGKRGGRYLLLPLTQ